ncbi:Sodium/hydrogen exchanger family-domain-containing protein [Choanephora cucurbitarum]|nr:Sodium/hydrogen exchanger family-domain-containing protein [Choanephora cucurbitarum]
MPIHVIPGEISTFTIAIAILSGFILFFGYVSMFLKEKLFLSEALVAVVVGIIAGPLVSNGFNPYAWDHHDEITKQLTRCIIAIQVMAVGIELPKHYLKKEWLTMSILLIPVMMFMWLISGLFIWALIPPINYLEALVISACICPTDPILANSVVKGRFAEKHVPAHIRNALSAESGANDGMGFPFLFLAIFLIAEDSVGVAIGKWIYITCLFQIALSCVIGVAVGFVARKVLQWSERNHLIDKPSFLAFAIALSLFLMSMTGFSGSDDLLACFAAGNAFSWDDWFRHETEEAHFQEVIDMMLNLAIFVYIGAIIPWSDFNNEQLGLSTWRLITIAVLVLFFRRLPIVVLLKPVMPAIKTYREAVFSGWFGPMGVGAVFLSIIAKEELEIASEGKERPISAEIISPVVLFVVFCSVLVHGTTIPLFKLGKRIRTRTLSITSISSNQVLRLPKLQFGQQLSKKTEDNIYHYDTHTMTELQRNTLFNTLQCEPSIETMNYHIPDSDFEIAEEDLLPDDSLEYNKSPLHPSSSPSPKKSPSTKEASWPQTNEASLEAQQAIRFLEPVKPRSVTTFSNLERNESSVSSLKQWIIKQARDLAANEDVSAFSEPKIVHTISIKHLFKRRKDVYSTDANELEDPDDGTWEHSTIENNQSNTKAHSEIHFDSIQTSDTTNNTNTSSLSILSKNI